MKEMIIAKLPEINWIKDEDLRDKTVEVWQRAITKGGWTVEELSDIPFTLTIDDARFSIIAHTRGVVHVSKNIADALISIFGNDVYKINYDVLIAGAILHDVGKLIEFEKVDGKYTKSRIGKLLRHPFSGQALCYAVGIPDEVAHCVAMHAKEGEGQRATTEAIIVNKADFACFEPLKLDSL